MGWVGEVTDPIQSPPWPVETVIQNIAADWSYLYSMFLPPPAPLRSFWIRYWGGYLNVDPFNEIIGS